MTRANDADADAYGDRLLPADPAVRAVARRLYAAVEHLPIVSPHGHVPAQWLADDQPFTDPTSLLISPDHYVFRLLHADGVSLDRLGVGTATLDAAGSREAWRLFCERWPLFRGTPSRYWMESVLSDVFGTSDRPSAATADVLYDHIASCLASETFRPRALFKSFGIDVLATTDDPCDDLRYHRAIAQDEAFDGRVVPTFRPDRYLEPAGRDFPQLMRALAEASGEDTGDFPGYLRALAHRRALLQGARRGLGRPQPHRRRHARARPCRGRAHLRRGPRAARRPRRRRPRCAATCSWRWPGCRSRTAWS